ncbi:adhesion G protein-coupled receptor F4-like [Chaetodon trifascialis]|uniref:adhesion G protein-coupled receptor F4-like n=1 Tax=Chaetodon trifascialis TaxID=109706 RepID=UPI0039960D52
MALLKALGYLVVILVMYCSLENQLHSQSLNVFFEDLMGTKASHLHPREKRATNLNSSHYELQAVINISDLEHLQMLLNTYSFPLTISSSAEIISIDITTVCLSNMSEYQCRCQESFAWSYNSCINHVACDAIVADKCGCINALPADGLYCQPNTSQTDPVDIDLVLDLRIPVTSVPNFIHLFREAVTALSLPHTITQSVKVVGFNFTTACYPNSTGGLQCQCEEQFAWSCDKCDIYSACSNATGQTCKCINGLPSDGQFCEPITNIAQCPTPTTGMVQTLLWTTPMTTPETTPETTPLTTPLTTPVTTPLTTPLTTPVTIPPPEERSLSFAMDIDYDPSYNDPTSEVYQTSDNSIKKQCKKHISNLEAAEIVEFRSGSTICDYVIRAISVQDIEIEAVQEGIRRELGEIYPLIADSTTPLKFEPSQAFFGKRVTVTCGPPPKALNFSTNWIAEWRREGTVIPEDSEHSIAKTNGASTLTVSRFFGTDSGQYECKLRDKTVTAALVFRQKSEGEFILKERPLVQVTPIRQKVNCEDGKEVSLQCSVNSPYRVKFKDIPAAGTSDKITHQFLITDCEISEKKFICQEENYPDFSKEITLVISREAFVCINDPVFGNGIENDKAIAPCDSNKVGEKTAVCMANGRWEDQQDNCVLQPVQDLLEQSESLNNNSLPLFLAQLSNVTVNYTTEVVESPATIRAIVAILSNIALASTSLSLPITKTSMKDILLTGGVLTINEAKESWDFLNTNDTRNTSVTGPTAESISSELLLAFENITSGLTSDSFDIYTSHILLNKTTFTDSFDADFDSSVEIDIPESDERNKSITVITFASMDNILPPRDKDNSTLYVINGRVVLVQSSGIIKNVSFTFDVMNDTLGNPQCVFWNFSLFDGLGGWDDKGCELVYNINETVSCNCNHLTSFSILMSPYSPDDPVLDIITYIGVGISMASLVICLIIEAVIWRKIRKNNTSYLRHVSVVNIAVSLLIANIWFIIGAAISDAKEENPPACSAATFFIHFFYLALFFWMLASALLLFYRTVSVFDGGLSKTSMLAIGFSLGYGAPLIIAIITIAVTAPKQAYIRGTGVCWLNWNESKALLAFVIPALVIVVINFVILLVVIYKMLRRRAVADAAQAAERHVLVVIARSLAVLTPFFGLTWGLGVGTMTSPYNRGIHISFAFFNSLQGFFILLFGTLLDRKVRSEIAIKSQTSGSQTRSTSAGHSSSSGLGFFRNWRRGRDGYNLSSSSSGALHSSMTT